MFNFFVEILVLCFIDIVLSIFCYCSKSVIAFILKVSCYLSEFLFLKAVLYELNFNFPNSVYLHCT